MKSPALDLLGLLVAGPCYDADDIGGSDGWLSLIPNGSSGACGIFVSSYN